MLDKVSFEIAAFFLSALCFAYCLVAKHRQYIPPKGFRAKLGNQHFLFLVMLFTCMICCLSSVSGAYLEFYAKQELLPLMYAFHVVYFLFHATLSLSFCLYIISVTSTKLYQNKLLTVLFFVPYIVSILLVATNPLTNWAFYMSDDLVYHRGQLILALYGFGVFYLAMGIFCFFKNMKAISKTDSGAVLTFILIATVGLIVQAVRSSLVVELFAESLACLVLMMVLEEKSGHIDPVTNLYNRVAFADINRRFIVTKQEYQLVVIKLDKLDEVMKGFSTRSTNTLLMNIAAFLVSESKVNEVYSYRRDELCVIFKDEEDNTSVAQSFAERVVKRFDDDWSFDSIKIRVSVTVSVIKMPDDMSSFVELEDFMVSNYQKSHIGSYIVPHEELMELKNEKIYEESLRNAINNRQLKVVFQPIWSVKEKKTVSLEALLRVKGQPLDTISPEIYIPIAESCGLIKEIGLYVFEEVLKFLNDPRIKNTNIEYVELNLSLYQFLFSDIVESFEELRKQYNVPAEKINLEITETSGALERAEVEVALKKFKELGYTLSLDDFGTGYSNLVRMIKYKFDNIKVDKSILYNFSKEEDSSKKLKDIMSLIKGLDSQVIQEGVETKEQLDIAIDAGADYIQGFYFSRAIDIDSFFEYLDKENK